MILNDYRDLVLETPLFHLKGLDIPDQAHIYAKLEHLHPAGGIKDRFGVYAVDTLVSQGVITPETVLIEATAGNAGLGIAFGALRYHLKTLFVIPRKFSLEKQTLLRALGAIVINTPAESGIEGAIAKAQDLLKKIPHSLSLKQFESILNPEAYAHSIGPEIYHDLPTIDAFVTGAGSGGSFSGVSSYLKQQNPLIQTILADPVGSTLGGGRSGTYSIEGIGNHFIP